jgi:hypothetical protein
MRKEITFITAALTTFVLAMAAGVVYAYKGLTVAQSPVNQLAANPPSNQPSSQNAVNYPLVAPPPVQSTVLSPQDASSVAAKFLNHTDLYSVELADYNGAQAYKVTFSSGDVVYIDMHGAVLATVPPPAPVVVSSDPPKRQGGGNSGGGGGGSQGGEHDTGEHEGGGD